MSECGLYQVVDRRDFRGHSTGTEFPARLDPRQERRAVQRGSIVRLGSVTPRPENYTFPEGWLSGPHTTSQPRRREAPLS